MDLGQLCPEIGFDGVVGHQPDALPVISVSLLHGHDHHSAVLLRQRRGPKLELAGDVLVDEENTHRFAATP